MVRMTALDRRAGFHCFDTWSTCLVCSCSPTWNNMDVTRLGQLGSKWPWNEYTTLNVCMETIQYFCTVVSQSTYPQTTSYDD